MQVYAPVGLGGACPERLKSSELAHFRGISFRDADLQKHGNPTFQLRVFGLLLLYRTVFPALKLSPLRHPRYNSSRTLSSSRCDGHGQCFMRVRVCAVIPVVLGNRREDISKYSRERCNCWGRTIQINTPLKLQKQLRSHGTRYKDSSGTTPVQGLQGRSSTTTVVYLHPRSTLWLLLQPRCFCIYVCAVFTRRWMQPIGTTFSRLLLKSTTHRRSSSCHLINGSA